MPRHSNYELLRIISMLLIVYHHMAYHSRFNLRGELTARKFFLYAMMSWGKVGVDIFMILTGFFVQGRPVRLSSILRTWVQVVWWSWSIFIVLMLRGKVMLVDDILESVFPVFFVGYWFVTSYIGTCMLSPALGKLTVNVTFKEFVGLLSMMFYMLCISTYQVNVKNMRYAYSDVMMFMFLFLIGTFLRTYQRVFNNIPTKILVICFLWAVAVNLLSIYWTATRRFDWVEIHGGPTFLTVPNHAPLAVFTAILMFLIAGRIEIHSKMINRAASVVFGIYLIHENRFLRSKIWQNWINAPQYSGHPAFYLIMCILPLVVFVCAGIAEWVRQALFGRIESWMIEHLGHIITKGNRYVCEIFKLDDDNEMLMTPMESRA
jgi:hypothetical protein